MALTIRKDDNVVVVIGKDAGKKGKVLRVLQASHRALVERVNMTKRHVRRKREDQQTGIVEIESSIHISNLMLFCKQCDGPARFKTMVMQDGSKSRVCKKCGEVL